jgi:hypothetical protein
MVYNADMSRITKALKVLVVVLLALPVCAVIAVMIMWAVVFRPESVVVQSPTGLGEVQFTRSGWGRDGYTALTIEARKSGDWSWKTVGQFQLWPRGRHREFQEARWTADGGAVLIYTLHDKPLITSEWEENGKTIHTEYPGWTRDTVTHAFDFREDRAIIPVAITPEGIDSASAQIKAIIGTGAVSPPIEGTGVVNTYRGP